MAAYDSNQSAPIQGMVIPPSGDSPPPPPPMEGMSEVPPPPITQPAGEVSPQGTATVAPRSGFNFKIILIILGVVVLLGALGYLVMTILLPMLNPTSREVTLTWWGLWEEESVVRPLIEEYQTANPNVKINYVKQSPQEYRERLTNALAKGSGPDVFRFHNTWTPMFRNDLATLPPEVMSASEFSQSFYPVAVSDLTVGSGIVGIPLEYDGLGLYINEAVFESYGKTPPTTWDELRQLAIELTDAEVGLNGVALGRTENVDHWPEILGLMMLQNGTNMKNPTGELAEAALTYYTLFSSVDEVWDETLPPSTSAFASGKLAMYFGPSWRALEIKAQNPNLKFKVVPVPQLPKDTPDEPNVTYATYWVEGVWKRSPNATEAWKFLKYLSSKETLQKLYRNASLIRTFGEPYPRVDMAEALKDDPYTGGVLQYAPDAKSWYLASRTNDGPTGINSQITKYFEDAINAVNKGGSVTTALTTVAAGVNQVLSQYGLVSAQTPATR